LEFVDAIATVVKDSLDLSAGIRAAQKKAA
jgi:hypothetical protein